MIALARFQLYPQTKLPTYFCPIAQCPLFGQKLNTASSDDVTIACREAPHSKNTKQITKKSEICSLLKWKFAAANSEKLFSIQMYWIRPKWFALGFRHHPSRIPQRSQNAFFDHCGPTGGPRASADHSSRRRCVSPPFGAHFLKINHQKNVNENHGTTIHSSVDHSP